MLQKLSLGTSTAMTITLASLANNSGRAATAVDNGTNLSPYADITVKIKTGSSGVSTTGYVDVYIIRSEDGTNYDDVFGGSNAAYTPVNAQCIGRISATANATTYEKVFDLASSGVLLPRKWSIGVYNATGAAFDSTAENFAVTYTLKWMQS